jgi:ABC-2 type transport system ATP-binding protein
VGRRVVAVDDVSFAVKRGEIFGFLGPNGAGKTTAIRAILGYLTLQSGTITVNGLDHRKDRLAIRRDMGYIPGDAALYDNFSGKELLRYFGSFRPSDPVMLKKLRSIFKVDLTAKIKSLSSGNRQQVVIIVALASNPNVLILDEPSSGLDPLMAARFHDLLRGMRDHGKTIFLSSHDLAEAQAICDRVGIIREGKIIMVESVQELRKKSVQVMHVEFASGDLPDVNAVSAIPNVINVNQTKETLQIKIRGDVNALLKFVTNHQVKRITLEESSLEEIFLEYYKTEADRQQED